MATANFSTRRNSNSANINDIIQFTNITEGDYSSCLWEFGDGATSNAIHASHEYLAPGNYQITLSVYNAQGSIEDSKSVTFSIASYIVDSEDTVVIQQPLNTYKRFDPAQIGVIHRSVAGSEFGTTWPLTGSTMNGAADNVSGRMASATTGEQTITASEQITIYSGTQLIVSSATNVWQRYTVTANVSGEADIHVDRAVPVMNNVQMYLAYNSATGTPIDDDIANDTAYTFNAFRMINTVDSNLMATGLSQSYSATGQLQRYGYNGTGQHVSFQYPNWSGMSVAEKFQPGSTQVSYPWVYWDGSLGVDLYDQADATEVDAASGSRFRNLRNGISTTDDVIGKVFYDEKRIAITDKEMATIMAASSNRNWNLPEPTVSFIPSASGWTSTGTAYYVTYAVRDDSRSVVDSMYCGHIQRVEDTVGSLDMQITVPAHHSPSYIDQLQVIIATGSSTSTYPDRSSAVYSAFTISDTLSVYTLTEMPGNDYNISDYIYSGNSNYPVGTEWTSWGYMSGNLQSDIYTMMAVCVGTQNEFNQTQNPTHDGAQSTWVSEVGLYNENDDLIMIGKLDTPIEVDQTKYITVKLELDL